MHGLMMDTPLLITSILQFAERNYPDTEIVSVTADTPVHRCRYRDVFRRARQLANALRREGLGPGDCVATLAWNDYRHLELYYAVSCSGQILHTVNPRLFPPQLEYILNHAADKLVFLDPLFVPLLERVWPALAAQPKLIVLCPEDALPGSKLKLTAYETWIGDQSSEFDWPVLDERSASALCYTSGTTGNPKGVLYSHRSTVLHGFASCAPNALGISHNETLLPVVPMFHVNAWGIPYSGLMAGAKLVLPGPKMGDPATLHALMEGEGVTLSLGVPTVWLGLLNWLREQGKTFSTLKRTGVGGAACPLAVMKEFEDRHGVDTVHAWGMTETSPVGTVNRPKPRHAGLDSAQRDALRVKQGVAVFGIDMKIVDDSGAELPWDGKSFGALKVRGPWVCSGYFKVDGGDSHDAEGWFETGDVATIDPDGYMQITDRTKDVIKSGGEWISSIELENQAVAHPGIAEAAVIGIPHEKWSERPLLLAVRAGGSAVTADELRDFLADKVASWWLPDDIEFVDELPHTATGKIHKVTLREQFAGYTSRSTRDR